MRIQFARSRFTQPMVNPELSLSSYIVHMQLRRKFAEPYLHDLFSLRGRLLHFPSYPLFIMKTWDKFMGHAFACSSTGMGKKVVPRLCECCRQSQAGMISKGRNKITKPGDRLYAQHYIPLFILQGAKLFYEVAFMKVLRSLASN